jgi:hypothetical protein
MIPPQYHKQKRGETDIKKLLIILGKDLIIVITITDISLDLFVRRVTRNSLINLATVVKPAVRGSTERTIIMKSKIFHPFLK